MFSEDAVYRYHLGRYWGPGGLMAFVMLNPSTADASTDDRTILQCISFARREGCGGLEVINLYALRSTDPALLRTHADPEGPENPYYWRQVLSDARVEVVVAAWGNEAANVIRPSVAFATYRRTPWLCLGTTAKGQPWHPSRRRLDAPLEMWRGGLTPRSVH